MLRVVRSELIRLRRGGAAGWMVLTAALTAMVNVFIFQSAGSADGLPASGPGTVFPSMAELVAPGGLMAGVGAVGSLLGVVALACWAIAAATDYASGMIRLTAQAEPRRVLLLLGKVVALLVWTAGAATVATAVNLLVAPVAAEAAGVPTEQWGDVGVVASAWLNTALSLSVWGVLGLVVATITRSAAVAIGAGTGYVLLFETLVRQVAEDAGRFLPGAALQAIAAGGSAEVGYAAALALGVAYGAVGLSAAALVFRRRDVVD
jgi:ABC-2 type transport system permease protein